MENTSPHILEILNKIIILQRQDFCDDAIGCDRPFLGPSPSQTSYNTRPIQLYNKYTAEPWSFEYTINGTTGTSNTFRIEDIEQNSITVRLLGVDQETSQYTNTNNFVTIDLATVGAIRCFSDTYIVL